MLRYRQGERPSISEFVDKHPELADEIRELFPALVVMEEIGQEEGASSRSPATQGISEIQALDQIGDYQVIREIGRGGMGVVYEAEQESLGRHVALKVLPPRSAADAICLARFRREARSAARLHHTNIVPVHEVGEAQGIHYYAMQFIQGQGLDEVLRELRRLQATKTRTAGISSDDAFSSPDSVDGISGSLARSLVRGIGPGTIEWIDAQKGAEGGSFSRDPAGSEKDGLPDGSRSTDQSAPGPNLALGTGSSISMASNSQYYRSAARLGLQIAEALAYAHGQNVLHRDIKPSNLLLDLQGTVWVTDFGLAKDDGDSLTQTGDIVGTLSYMAPERLHGVSDTRSDIYSLGVTFYELVTLQPAFKESDRGRLIMRVTHEEPPRPTKLERRVPRDLETIVLKAMAKEPAHRYPSAEAMADDLRRFLGDRPILARRTSLPEHLWRWCRRNPIVFVMGRPELSIEPGPVGFEIQRPPRLLLLIVALYYNALPGLAISNRTSVGLHVRQVLLAAFGRGVHWPPGRS